LGGKKTKANQARLGLGRTHMHQKRRNSTKGERVFQLRGKDKRQGGSSDPTKNISRKKGKGVAGEKKKRIRMPSVRTFSQSSGGARGGE